MAALPFEIVIIIVVAVVFTVVGVGCTVACYHCEERRRQREMTMAVQWAMRGIHHIPGTCD